MPEIATEMQHHALVNGVGCNRRYDKLYTPSGNDVIDNKSDSCIMSRSSISYIMSDIFQSEADRLKTFDHWPLNWLDKHVLARTGVFFTGEDDKVKCYFCGVEIGRWETEDHPVQEHLRWSPNCPLLRRRTTNNKPLDMAALNEILPPISYDICGANDANEMVSDYNGGPACSASSSMTSYYVEFPEYAIEAARIRSYAEWPRNMKQKPEQLAEAGFFYTGTGDRVKCFSCGGGLKDWDDEDLPWEQHALWLNKCRYLKLMKGEQYIEDVIAQHKAKEECKNKPTGEPSVENAAATSSECEQSVAVASAVASDAETSVGKDEPTPALLAIAEDNVAAAVTATAAVSEATKASSEVPVMAAAAVSTTTTAAPAALALPTSAAAAAGNSSIIPEEKLCKICYAAEFNTAFLPCGHVVACAKCASSVTKCPMCRKPFSDVMRVYFS